VDDDEALDYEQENPKRKKKTTKKPVDPQRKIMAEIDLIDNALTIPNDSPKGKKGKQKEVDLTIVSKQQITINDCIQSNLPVSLMRLQKEILDNKRQLFR
jgi:hypothetical protein